ncbi:hypothetical protein [Polaromonas sp. CG9_12]|nr:hypothetical protein [Polaromonas sp. CG9_12]
MGCFLRTDLRQTAFCNLVLPKWKAQAFLGRRAVGSVHFRRLASVNGKHHPSSKNMSNTSFCAM